MYVLRERRDLLPITLEKSCVCVICLSNIISQTDWHQCQGYHGFQAPQWVPQDVFGGSGRGGGGGEIVIFQSQPTSSFERSLFFGRSRRGARAVFN